MVLKDKSRDGQRAPGDGIAFAEETDNAVGEGARSGFRMDKRARKIAVLAVMLVAIYAFALVFPKDVVFYILNPGTDSATGGYTASWFIGDLQENVRDLVAVLTGNADAAKAGYGGWMIRYVVIALAGAGLALSGAVYQGSFRNALVSPSTLGVMSGAQLGMFAWVVIVVSSGGSVSLMMPGDSASDAMGYIASSYGLALFSFAGCLLVVGIVLVTMRAAGGGTSAIMMIITGQVVGGVIGAVTNTIRYYYVATDPWGEAAAALKELTISSFYREFGPADIVAIGVPLLVTFAVVMHLRQKMMLLAFEEGERRTLGIDSRRMQAAVVGLCTLLTAIIVSFCGTVGFVGFLVPHLARRLVGPNFKYLLPASAMLGAVFVLGAYVLLLVTMGGDYSNMVGMYISIAGSTVFLVTALRGKGVAYGTFR